MSIYDHAERELDLIGMTDDGDMNGMMRKHILHMIEEFAKERHSGFSASYAIQCLEKLLRFEPLSPLTGEDWEWFDVAEMSSGPLWQNSRCSRVFKDENGAYDIDGKVFWEWYTDPETGEKYKSHFTSKDSRVPVTFPYIPTTVYEEAVVDRDGSQ
jgi:hypothetical protein